MLQNIYRQEDTHEEKNINSITENVYMLQKHTVADECYVQEESQKPHLCQLVKSIMYRSAAT